MVDDICLLAVLPLWQIKYVKLSLAKIEIVVCLAVGDRRLVYTGSVQACYDALTGSWP